MSNTEQMVSLPRVLAERIAQICMFSMFKEDYLAISVILAQPAAQHQVDPDRALKDALFACLAAGGDDREYGGVATAGDRQGWVRFATVADGVQHQGEPVAYQIRSKTDRTDSQWTPWRECCETTRAMHSHEVGRFNQHGIMREIRPVYTRPDAGEAERLRAELRERREIFGMQEEKIDTLNAQLAERDALLRKLGADPGGSIRHYINSIDATLSASAERNQCDGCQAGIPLVKGSHRLGRPDGYADTMSCQAGRYASAEPISPVERDEFRDLLMSMTCSYRSAIQAGYDRITALGGDCDSVDKMLADFPDYAKARAALERKP